MAVKQGLGSDHLAIAAAGVVEQLALETAVQIPVDVPPPCR
jgi:hypothetical protein